MPCRALEAFRPVQVRWATWLASPCLNALSGIGGVQTYGGFRAANPWASVLMPCRALEAFRRRIGAGGRSSAHSLNALSGIGGVQTTTRNSRSGSPTPS